MQHGFFYSLDQSEVGMGFDLIREDDSEVVEGVDGDLDGQAG